MIVTLSLYFQNGFQKDLLVRHFVATTFQFLLSVLLKIPVFHKHANIFFSFINFD